MPSDIPADTLLSLTSKTTDVENPRRIRSFVKRAGRMTPSQEHAIEHYWARYGLELNQGPLEFSDIFGNDHPVIMEIGFGMGDSLSTMAATMPENNYIGIEVHRPGVGRLLNNLSTQELGNVRVFCDDAIEVMAQCIQDDSLAGVQLFFPDPWHKKKHNKRRIVQPRFAQDIRQKLCTGGVFHMATDWQPYAEHMMEVMEPAPGYSNQAGANQFSPQPEFRPSTKFQRRGEGKGHGVWDLMYKKEA